VRGGEIAAWPLRPAPAGPVVTGVGTARSVLSGKCMAAAGNGSSDGTKVVAWKCVAGAASQQWAAYSDGTLRINGKCLDVAGASTRLGAKVQLWSCDGRTSQEWALGQVSFNQFGPIVGIGSGNVLTDPGSGTQNGTQLQMGADRGDLSPSWHVSFRHYLHS
jgi:hypothetical protein